MKEFISVLFLLAVTILFVNCSAHSQIPRAGNSSNNGNVAVKDSLVPPVIDLQPKGFKVKKSEGRFIERDVKVLNRGGSDLKISKVIASCRCSSATVLNGSVEPMTIGKIRLMVNQDGVEGDNNIIEFVIQSNAKNSPTIIRIELVD